MTAALHPAIRVDWLVLRRTGWAALARVFGTPGVVLACCAAVACGDLYGGYRWCLAAGGLLALGGSHAIAHDRLLGALERWQFGWCGALPVARGTARLTLLLVATAALAASSAFVAGLLLIASRAAPDRGDLAYALAGIVLGLVSGTATATLRVFRRGTVARAGHADGMREPLFTLAWLDDARLPHLIDWQRRAALVRWRRGGGVAAVGIVLAAVPDGPSLPVVAGLTLLAVSWAWLAVVMRASADSSVAMAGLLGATPLDAGRARKASLRYPFAAWIAALAWMAAGAVLGRSGLIAPVWAVCTCAVSAWPLLRILRATRRPESRA
jgi:hypothetical protein